MRLYLALLLCGVPALIAADWPQFLGPDRNGTSTEAIAGSWETTAPRQIWKNKVGEGFAGPVVSSNRVVLFHRVGDSEILTALDAAKGTTLWESKSPTAYRDDFGFDEGPRAAPSIVDGRVYAMGAEGLIRCVDLRDGTEIWAVPSKTVFHAAKGFFGMACAPLVQGREVILNIGGSDGAGIIALDKDTGALRWKATDDEASYSSPVVGNLAGGLKIVVFTRDGVVLLEPASGHVSARMHWRSRENASVNAAVPLIIGQKIFLTASYETGAILLDAAGGTLKKIWSGNDSLSSHYATPVERAGFLYGFHGRQEYGPSFRAVDLATGKVAWNEDGFGAGTVTAVGDKLLILRESGELLLAEASPKMFQKLGAAQILGSGTRAYPAVSNHRLYARDKSSLVCVSLP